MTIFLDLLQIPLILFLILTGLLILNTIFVVARYYLDKFFNYYHDWQNRWRV